MEEKDVIEVSSLGRPHKWQVTSDMADLEYLKIHVRYFFDVGDDFSDAFFKVRFVK